MTTERQVAERLMEGVHVTENYPTLTQYFVCPVCKESRLAWPPSSWEEYGQVYCNTCGKYYRVLSKRVVKQGGGIESGWRDWVGESK